MKEKQQPKEYKTPKFQLVRTDESNKVFFAESGTPGDSSLGVELSSMGSTYGAW